MGTLTGMMDETNRQAVRESLAAGRRSPLGRRALAAAGLAGFLAGLLLVQTAQALPPFAARGADRAGRVAQGYLGINFRDVGDEQITALKLKDSRGAEIFVIDHDGPGCKAGLLEHDVILQMNGQGIEGEEQLRHMLRDMPAGRTVNFLISRDGQQQTLSAQLANRNTVGEEAWNRHMTVPEPSGPESSWHGSSGFLGGNAPSSADLPKHGFMGSAILSSSYTGALLEMMGPQLADYFGAQGGLLVRAVDPSSPAAVAGMHAGDVVVKVNAVAVVSSADWLKTVHENRGKPLSVVVLRDKREQILTLTPDSKKRSSVMPKFWPGVRPHPVAVASIMPLAEMQ